eukprot:scaffold18269_cov71-Phaeocystis_antarctica.AAC.1
MQVADPGTGLRCWVGGTAVPVARREGPSEPSLVTVSAAPAVASVGHVRRIAERRSLGEEHELEAIRLHIHKVSEREIVNSLTVHAQGAKLPRAAVRVIALKVRTDQRVEHHQMNCGGIGDTLERAGRGRWHPTVGVD